MSVNAVVRTSFHALRHRNFRVFWLGQCISLIGTWMQNIGQAWLVLQLTHSAFKLGVIVALQFAPMLFFSLFAGVYIDRFAKRKIIIFSQFIMMLLAFTLALLDWTGLIRYWHIVILATALGFANTIDMPARQAFVYDLVGKEDIMNAIALNSSIFNAARAIGPAVGGILIGLLGTAICFFINGFSFLAVLTSLLFINVNGTTIKRYAENNIYHEIKEGLSYIKNMPVILITMIMLSVISVFAINFNVLVPVFTQNILHQNAAGYGLLMTAFGIGALVGSLSLAAMSRQAPNNYSLFGAGLGLATFVMLIGLQKSYWLTGLLLALAGWCMVYFFGMANTTIQLNTEDRLRGRVMSVYTFTFGGLAPIGSMFAGTMAHWFKTPLTFVIGGLISVIVCLYAIFRQFKSRPGIAENNLGEI